MAAPTFDSNLFYRITSATIGETVSLDVVNPADGIPTGQIDMTPSGPFTGQAWQILNTSSTAAGTFLLSTKFLGARMKLDLAVIDAIYFPFLKNFTTTVDQSWIISQFGNSSNATYSIAPNLLGGSIALTVNTTTKQPFLTTAGEANQEWALTEVAEVNDVSFSASALLATSTSTSITSSTLVSSPSTNLAATPSVYTSSVPTGGITETSSSSTTHSGPALLAEIVTPVTLVIVILILVSMLLLWRRRTARHSTLDQKIGYPIMQDSRAKVDAWPLSPPSEAAPPSSSALCAASAISSSAYPESSHIARGFPSPLMARPRSWSRSRVLEPYYRFSGSSLETRGEVQDEAPQPVHGVPISATSPFPPANPWPLPTEPEPEMGEVEDQSADATLVPSQSFRRPLSLISRWRL